MHSRNGSWLSPQATHRPDFRPHHLCYFYPPTVANGYPDTVTNPGNSAERALSGSLGCSVPPCSAMRFSYAV